MSIIVVTKIPGRYVKKKLVYILVKALKCRVYIQKVVYPGGLNVGRLRVKYKEAYVQIDDKLNPAAAVNTIERQTNLGAYISDHIPDDLENGPSNIRNYNSQTLTISSTEKVMEYAVEEILAELQYKYTGLHALSKKSGHKLLLNVAQTIFDRLKQVINLDNSGSGFRLTKAYRVLHPHFGDFQLILSSLHALEDAKAEPRSQLNEAELIDSQSKGYLIDDIPYASVKSVCNKYSEKIVHTIQNHIQNLNAEITEGDTEEEVARKKVREELKNFSRYMPTMIKQVISEHFVPQKTVSKLRIYGEPCLPTKDLLMPFLRKHHVSFGLRSDRMYNLLRFSVQPNDYSSVMALDGTGIGGCKLIVRPSITPLYKIPADVMKQMIDSFTFGTVEPSGHLCIDEWIAEA